MKFCSYIKSWTSSQEQSFNAIALFLLEKQTRKFFCNSELWMALSKSPLCQCPKITFKLLFGWLLHNGSSHQHSIIGKKIKLNMVSWHNLMTSTLFSKLFSLLSFLGNSYFFCLPCNFISFNVKEWNFAVILSLNDK